MALCLPVGAGIGPSIGHTLHEMCNPAHNLLRPKTVNKRKWK